MRSTGARVLRTDTDGSVAISIAGDGQIGVGTSGARRTALSRSVLAELDVARSALENGLVRDTTPFPPRAPAPPFVPVRVAFSCGIPSSG